MKQMLLNKKLNRLLLLPSERKNRLENTDNCDIAHFCIMHTNLLYSSIFSFYIYILDLKLEKLNFLLFV